MTGDGKCYFKGGIGDSDIMSKAIAGFPDHIDITKKGVFMIFVFGSNGGLVTTSYPETKSNFYIFTNDGTNAKVVTLAGDGDVAYVLVSGSGSNKYLRITPGNENHMYHCVTVVPIGLVSIQV